MDPPEAAAELINEGGGAFVKMHLRKGRNHQTERGEGNAKVGGGAPWWTRQPHLSDLEGLQAVDKLSPEQVFPQRDCSL